MNKKKNTYNKKITAATQNKHENLQFSYTGNTITTKTTSHEASQQTSTSTKQQ